METGIMLAGQSPVFAARTGELVQMDLRLSLGQPPRAAPVCYAGTVIDRKTRLPVPGAWVTLCNGPYTYRCRTRCDGGFGILLPPDWCAASVQLCKEGYRTRYIGLRFLTGPNDVLYMF